MFTSVSDERWDDRPVIVVGTGPSLEGFDFARLDGLGHIVAVKEAYRELPFAELCFGLDRRWMRRCQSDIEKLVLRMPVYCSIPTGDRFDTWTFLHGVKYLKGVRYGDAFVEDRSMVETGGNSGFAAVNLVYHKRPKDIVLFGYDYDKGVTGHYCPDRYPISNYSYLRSWGKSFNGTVPQLKAAGINVLNASPHSTVEAFERVSHDQAFEHLDRIRSQGSAGLQRGPLQPHEVQANDHPVSHVAAAGLD